MKDTYIYQVPEDKASKGKEKCNNDDDNGYALPGILRTLLTLLLRLAWLLYLLLSHILLSALR